MIALQNRWTLITGAARGVGRQIALHMAQLGSNLVLHSRDLSHTRDLAEECKKLGALQVWTIAAELSDADSVEAMLDELEGLQSPIDMLFCNAAVMTAYRSDFWNVPDSDYHTSFMVNTITPIRMAYRLLPGMIARGYGRVVMTTSGIRNEPELMAYAASKAALDKFVYDMAPKLANTGVAMNLLDPGWLRTDLGGPNAPNAVESVVPGALVPALLDAGICGRWFSAQDYAGLTLEAALEKATRL